MISFLSSLLIAASVSTNAISSISINNSINIKSFKNNTNVNNINLKNFNNEVKNVWVNQATWNKFQVENANINIDYHTFNPLLKTMTWKQVILSQITKSIDYHYQAIENIIYDSNSVLSNLLNQNQIWFTILGEKNASLSLNNNDSNIFNPFWEPNKNISTFYFRISNNNSMNWNTNNSFLDVSVNICNFDYRWTKDVFGKLVASGDATSNISNFQNQYKYYQSQGTVHHLCLQDALTPAIISPQLTNWNLDFKYLDYFYFGLNVSDVIYGLKPEYGNYNNVKTYYWAFNGNTITKNTTYSYNANYSQITSKVTNETIHPTNYSAQLLYVYTFILISYNDGKVIVNFSLVNNKLYVSIWFWKYTISPDWMDIKTKNSSLTFNYNTNIFDNRH